ncbi:MAG: type II toxin-antitoxin system prevent-host-death family antitoxin [Minisyncoccia bacterium]
MAGIRKEGSEEARKKLPSLLERAHRGQVTVITKRGVPYAAIVPITEAVKKTAGIRLQNLRGSGKGLWREDAAAWVNEIRGEWR